MILLASSEYAYMIPITMRCTTSMTNMSISNMTRLDNSDNSLVCYSFEILS